MQKVVIKRRSPFRNSKILMHAAWHRKTEHIAALGMKMSFVIWVLSFAFIDGYAFDQQHEISPFLCTSNEVMGTKEPGRNRPRTANIKRKMWMEKEDDDVSLFQPRSICFNPGQCFNLGQFDSTWVNLFSTQVNLFST